MVKTSIKTTNSDAIRIACCFALVFFFGVFDNGISPITELFHEFYGIPSARVLLLISACSFGSVLGLLLGPLLVANFSTRRLLALSVFFIMLSVLAFILFRSFSVGILSRLILGLWTGVLTSAIWSVAYHGMESKNGQEIILTSIMTGRPVALVFGIPLVGTTAVYFGWKIPFLAAGLLVVVAGVILFYYIVEGAGKPRSLSASTFFSEYPRVFRLRLFVPFYLSIVLNSVSYLGFYALGGLWFFENYGLTSDRIADQFLFFGIGEVIGTLGAPILLQIYPYRYIFPLVALGSLLLFSLFIPGQLPLPAATFIITLFVILTRVWILSNVRNVSSLFAIHPNKGTLGSLVTLSAWTGFTLASALQAILIPEIGLRCVGWLLWTTLGASMILSYFVLRKPELFEKAAS